MLSQKQDPSDNDDDDDNNNNNNNNKHLFIHDENLLQQSWCGRV